MLQKNVLALCGSTRLQSTNHRLIRAIAELAGDALQIHLYEGLATLPHFNPDNDTLTSPPIPEVAAFREQLHVADGVLICTPEYAMGVPGTLKNALDWTVSSCEFTQKPVALITASTLGELAHASLSATLKILEANIPAETSLLITAAPAKITMYNQITDAPTLAAVEQLLRAFGKLLE